MSIINGLRSKRFRAVSEQRMRNESQDLAKNGARPKPKIPLLGLSLLRNQTETLCATQANNKKRMSS